MFTVIRAEFVFDSEQDNVEQQQTEQKEQGVMQEALQETMSNLETLKEAESKSILSSREGGCCGCLAWMWV